MLFKEENKYLDIARNIIENGYTDTSRTGINIRKTHAEHMTFSLLNNRVPILSTRKIPVKSPIIEMIWFISGSTDIKFLKDNNVSIWDSWVKPETAVYDTRMSTGIRDLAKKGIIKLREDFNDELFLKLGPGTVNYVIGELTDQKVQESKLLSGSIGEGAYGAQWRKWEDIRLVPYENTALKEQLKSLGYENMDDEIHPGAFLDGTPDYNVYRKQHDQLQAAIDLINNNPDSRRIIVSAWNPGKIDLCALPPCHSFFQFLPFEKDGVKYLDLALTCRSQDFLVGTAFNVMQYGVLCQMVAKLTGRTANALHWTGNNTHIYQNQIDIFNEFHSERSPILNPQLKVVFNKDKEYKTIDDFKVSDITIEGYDNFHEVISYPVAV